MGKFKCIYFASIVLLACFTDIIEGGTSSYKDPCSGLSGEEGSMNIKFTWLSKIIPAFYFLVQIDLAPCSK